MTVADGSQTWNAWVSLGTAITCFLFVTAYAVLARWWRTYEGRVMMGKATAIGLLALYTFIITEVAPDSASARWARVVLVGIIGVFMVFQTIRLVTNQLGRTYDNRSD
ncbi:membrane protein [Streptomyces phage Hiyaa]|uniref:Membrane protein n=1 Tax=Streptomyces phage Hiyaa TaxID=2499072 RepID=A0A3S9U8Y3_9CAUD|nr:membrane protein [Streptomyces phage Hiyaa]AZS06669.1 membrane protein [Streptomyces phage Hiyaa]